MSHIFVHGIGAVSPAGWGVPALRQSVAAGSPLPVQTLARPGWEDVPAISSGSKIPPGVSSETLATATGTVALPKRTTSLQLKVRPVPPPAARLEFLAHPRLRRASPMSHYAVAAALEALGPDVELIRSGGLQLGIVTSTLTGGISYSRRFYQEVLQNPATASPMIFPETVFNAPASHLAAYLGASAINYALVGDAGTFMQGLAVAAGWLENGTVGACVVIGAEEPDWTAADALRLFNRRAIHASGAGAIYLKTSVPSQNSAPPNSSLQTVVLAGVTDSFAATRRPGRDAAARKMRAQLPPGAADELLCPSEPHNAVWRDWPGKISLPKEVLGEGFAAGAAWQCVLACDAIQQGECVGANASVTGAGGQTIGARFVKTIK